MNMLTPFGIIRMCLAAGLALAVVDTRADEVRKMKESKLVECSADPASLSFYIEERQGEEGKVYTLILENYVGNCWVFVRDDTESLVITAAGEETGLKPRGSFSYRKRGHAKELTYYDINIAILNQLAAAEKVDLKIVCENFTLKRCFNKDNFKKLLEFMGRSPR